MITSGLDALAAHPAYQEHTGLECPEGEARGYGEAEGLDPDPRGVLDAMAACP